MKIKGILFDKDGVLVDFASTWVEMAVQMAHDWAAMRGLDAGQLLSVAGYDPETHSFSPGSVWAAGNTDDLVAVWNKGGDAQTADRLAAFVNERCEKVSAVPLAPAGELQAMFRQLRKAGFRLGLATNDVEAGARRTMESFGLASMMEAIIGYDSVARPKPAPDPVIAFCRHCGISANEVLMIGDNIHDMEMASAAGCGLRIGALSGNSQRAALEPHADFLLDTILDLPQLLRQYNLMP